MNAHPNGPITVKSYRDLRVWQVAVDLAVEAYRLGSYGRRENGSDSLPR